MLLCFETPQPKWGTVKNATRGHCLTVASPNRSKNIILSVEPTQNSQTASEPVLKVKNYDIQYY